jgi:Asp-tRNA(Asn)/Glu-tRNA(Gln) amidotransferase A subunit family amidase
LCFSFPHFNPFSFLNKSVLGLFGKLLKVTGNKLSGNLATFMATRPSSILQIQQQIRQHKMRLFQAFDHHHIDLLICPANATPAVLHGTRHLIPPVILSYLMLFNVFDCPAGVVPISHVTEEDLKNPRRVNDLMETILHKSEQDSLGLPVGIQVVARPFHDELCLGMMKVISKMFPFQMENK